MMFYRIIALNLFEDFGMLIVAIACVIAIFYKNRLAIKSNDDQDYLLEEDNSKGEIDSRSLLTRFIYNHYFQSIQNFILKIIHCKSSVYPTKSDTLIQQMDSCDSLFTSISNIQDSTDTGSEDIDKNLTTLSHSVSFQGLSQSSEGLVRSSSATENLTSNNGKSNHFTSKCSDKAGQIQFTVFFNAFSTILKIYFIKVFDLPERFNLESISIHGLIQDEVKKRRFKTKICSVNDGYINETATFEGITTAMLPKMIMRLRLYGETKKSFIHVQKLYGEFLVQFNRLSPINGTKVICKSFYVAQGHH